MFYSAALRQISKYKVYKYTKQPGFDLKLPHLKLPLYGIQTPCVCAIPGVDFQQDAGTFVSWFKMNLCLFSYQE